MEQNSSIIGQSGCFSNIYAIVFSHQNTILQRHGAKFHVAVFLALLLCLQFLRSIKPPVTDAILIGKQIHENAIPVKLIDLLCTNFASHYGLLGQALGMDLSAPVYSSAPLYYAPNSEKYGKELFYFKDRLHRIYRHYMTTQGEWNRGQKNDLGICGTLNYRLTPGRTPQIVWGVEAMEEVMWLTCASLIMGERPGLKVCKNCGRVYYNSHAKSEFCGAKCRNRYNAKAFRERANTQ